MKRFRFFSGSIASLVLFSAGCTSNTVRTIQITPPSYSLVVGQTANFLATGIIPRGQHPAKTEDATNLVTWTSDAPAIATVSSAGLVTAMSAGTANITASMLGAISGTATVTVSPVSTRSLVSLTIIPSAISVGDLQDTGNFIAIGKFSAPPIFTDLTNSVTWISSFPDDFPVSTNNGGTQTASGGIVTAYAAGSAVITAEATDSDGSIQTATASFSCPLVIPAPPTTPGSCYTGQFGPLKATLTVYGEGLNTTNWLVTADSATGTKSVIHCGPGWTATGNAGGSVCTGIYPVDTTVTLIAPAQSGVAFGGWTNNCVPTTPMTAAGPNACTVTLTSINGGSVNAAVGAIFNNTTP